MPPEPIKKQRILVVEDEPDLVRLVCLRLEASGYEVGVAVDGEEALTKARADLPDLILLDLMLPKLHGDEVCKILKADSRFQKIPILLFTARKSNTENKQMLECGADGYLYKPYTPKELLETIRSHILEVKDKEREVPFPEVPGLGRAREVPREVPFPEVPGLYSTDDVSPP